MDGVERVMVLGILAVIVAILSFAWGATDDGVLAQDGVTDGGTSSSGVPLSSASGNTTKGVVVTLPKIDEPMVAQERSVDIVDSLLGDRSYSTSTRPRIPFRPAEQGAEQGSEPRGREAEVDNAPPRVTPVVPEGALGERAVEAPPALPLKADEADGPRTKAYAVVEGDTLWQIAYREVSSGDTGRIVDLIQELNPTIDAAELQIGQTLQLPVELPAGAASKDLGRLAEKHSASVYTIVAGDTLRSIAGARLGDSARWMEIYRLNPNTIREPGQIRVGLRILVPEQ